MASEKSSDAPELAPITGRVKWFDATRGFGFLVSDEFHLWSEVPPSKDLFLKRKIDHCFGKLIGISKSVQHAIRELLIIFVHSSCLEEIKRRNKAGNWVPDDRKLEVIPELLWI